MTTRIKLRRDTAANWTQTNPVLAAGEPGLETDTGKVKYGNGTNTWTQLSYGGGDGATLTAEGNVVVTAGSTEHWIATQRKEQGGTTPSALRYDSQGNLYALTRTYDDAADYDVTVITKYTATGNIAWQKTFSDTYPMALAIDSSDRAYITVGIDAPVVIVIKFDIIGEILWKKDYNIGPIPAYGAYIEEKSTTTLALAILIASDGPEPTNILVLEISAANGSILLKKSLQQPDNGLVVLTGIDVDPDENVFITGWYEDSGVGKMFIEKLDQDLEPVWTKSLEAPDNYDMYSGDCASDALGNIYVVGAYQVETTNSNIDNDPDKSAGILTKLNSSGVVMWTRRLGPGPCGSWIAGLTATATGDVYLSSLTFAKKTTGLPGDTSEEDREDLGQNKMIVARYDTLGNVVWQRYVDVANLQEEESDGPEFSRGQAIAVFDDKFAVDGYGYSWNTTPFRNGSSADNEYDYFVTQLPTEGTDLTIGGLNFTESRVPARFVTYATSDSPLTHANWNETITAETSTLVADTDIKIANSLVQSETYQYTFGADGTLTIPNDGDLRLTQSQVGWFMGIDSREANDDIRGECIAVDSQGNSYLAGEDTDLDRTFVTKISPEGERLWSMSIDEDDDGYNNEVSCLKIHPTTGHIMVICWIFGDNTYSVLFTIDQDTGRILDHKEFADSNGDVRLTTIAWTSTGTYVLGGFKNGEYSEEFPVLPQTGSGTGVINILRSAIPDLTPNPNTWQIGGTGFSVFEDIAYVDRYTGLTGTTRQGTGATFDIENLGNGTYSASVVNGGSNYLVGHKIKILGTSLTSGDENTQNFAASIDFTLGDYKIFSDGSTSYFALQSDSVDPANTKTLLTDSDSIVFNTTSLGSVTGEITGSYGAISGTSYYGWALVTNVSPMVTLDNNVNTFTIGNGTYTGATPDNDIILTVATVDAGAITSVTNTGAAFGTSTSTATGLSGTNTDVGSGFTLTLEGPFDDNNYNNYWNREITANGSNYVNGDVIVIPGTSLGGASTANDLTINLYKDEFSFYINSMSGVAQSTIWKLNTTTAVDFTAEGSWDLVYSKENQSLLITPTWQRTFGTATDDLDEIYAVAIDSEDNIIAVGEAEGELAEGNLDDLAVVYKFSNAGTLLWARQLNDENDDCQAQSVTTIGTDIYVVHENDSSDIIISKLNGSGTVQWQRITDGYDSAIARTADGNLLVAVEYNNNDIDDDAIKVFLLTPAGETVWKRWLSAITDQDTDLGSWGETLVVDAHSFYITGHNSTNDYTWAWAARLPLDGSGTGEYGQFRYTDVNVLTSGPTSINNINYDVATVDLEDADNYAGILGDSSAPTIDPTTTVTVTDNTGDYAQYAYYPTMVVEVVRDTDGGNIVFPDGTKQSTSATDIPQRLFNGIDYTLGLNDRGHHILCTDDLEQIRIPYNSRVEFPIGTVITIVNPRGDAVTIYTEGSSIQVMIPGDDNYSNGGYFDLFAYGMATLLKIGTDQWVLAGNVESE